MIRASLRHAPNSRVPKPPPLPSLQTGRRHPLLALFVGLSAVVVAPSVHAKTASTEPAAAIIYAVTQQLPSLLQVPAHATMQISPVAPESNLDVPSCPSPIVSASPVPHPLVEAKVKCRNPDWTIYVPVHLQAWVHAITAVSTLAPGALISANSISTRRIDALATPAGFLTNPDAAIGKVVRTRIDAGTPISPTLLQEPTLVHRGQSVTIHVRDGDISITTRGRALQSGRKGDTILVRNPSTQEVLHATVTSAGQLTLSF